MAVMMAVALGRFGNLRGGSETVHYLPTIGGHARRSR
jgi:hypothetical protein